MADEKLEVVKVKMSPLWTFRLVLWIVIGVVVLLSMIFAVMTVVALMPKISAALGAAGALSGMVGGGGYDGQGNYSNGGNTGSNIEAYMESLAAQLRTDIDAGNWDAAAADLGRINDTVSLVPASQLPSGLTDALRAMGSAISSRNKTAADLVFSQMEQLGG